MGSILSKRAPRCELSAAEVEDLIGELDRKLDGIGLETQPEIAARVLDLTSSRSAGPEQFAEVIRADPALAARVLRMANSAFFAQSREVTTIERACMVLGSEKLRSIALGFYLSRTPMDDPSRAVCRRNWSESVFRACLADALAAELAEHGHVPSGASADARANGSELEALGDRAFVVGLLLDAGVPLAFRMLGQDRGRVYLGEGDPGRMFRHEERCQPFTHVDIVSALVRRWRFPSVLAQPIAWHHARPAPSKPRDLSQWLHRIAYCVGQASLREDCTPVALDDVAAMGLTHLGLDRGSCARAAERASVEHRQSSELFRDVAESVGDIGALADLVSHRLQSRMDDEMERAIQRDCRLAPARFELGGRIVEVQGEASSQFVSVCLMDSADRPLASIRVRPSDTSARGVALALGLRVRETDEIERLETYLRSLA